MLAASASRAVRLLPAMAKSRMEMGKGAPAFEGVSLRKTSGMPISFTITVQRLLLPDSRHH